MKTLGTYVLIAFVGGACSLMGQNSDHRKSPDLQQQSHPATNPQKQETGHSPEVAQPSTMQSPDTEQEKRGKSGSHPKHHRQGKNNARQAHGTPEPAPQTPPQPAPETK